MLNSGVRSSSLRNTEGSEAGPAQSFIDGLPVEIVVRIMTHLGFRDTVVVVRVCRRWRAYAQDLSLWNGAREPEVRAVFADAARRVQLCALVGRWKAGGGNPPSDHSIAGLAASADEIRKRVQKGDRAAWTALEPMLTRRSHLGGCEPLIRDILVEEQLLHYCGLPSQFTPEEAGQFLVFLLEYQQFTKYAIAFMRLPMFQPTDRQLLSILVDKSVAFFPDRSSQASWLTHLSPHVVSFYLAWTAPHGQSIDPFLVTLQMRTGLGLTLEWLNGFAKDILSERFCPNAKIPEVIPDGIEEWCPFYRRPRWHYVEVLESRRYGSPLFLRPLIRASLEARDSAFTVFGCIYLDIAMRIYDQDLCAALLEAGVTVRSWTLEEARAADNPVYPRLRAAWEEQQTADLGPLPSREDRGLFSACIRSEDEQRCKLLIQAGYPVRFEDLEEATNEASRLLPLLDQAKNKQIAESRAALRVREEETIAHFRDQGGAAGGGTPSLSTYIYQDFSTEAIEQLRRLGLVYDEEALVAALILEREGDFPYPVDTSRALSARAFQHLLYYRGWVGVAVEEQSPAGFNETTRYTFKRAGYSDEDIQDLMRGEYARKQAACLAPSAIQMVLNRVQEAIRSDPYCGDGHNVAEYLYGARAKWGRTELGLCSVLRYLRSQGLKASPLWVEGMEAWMREPPPLAVIPEEVMETRFPCPQRAGWRKLDRGALEAKDFILKHAVLGGLGIEWARLKLFIFDHKVSDEMLLDLIEYGFVYDAEVFVWALINGREEVFAALSVDCSAPLPAGLITELLDSRDLEGSAARAISLLERLISKGIRATPAWLEDLENINMTNFLRKWQQREIAKVRAWIQAQLNPGSSDATCSLQ